MARRTPWAATRSVSARGSDGSDDLEIAAALPVGHRVLPLPPLPLASGGEVVDELVAEPVARALGCAAEARRFDQAARCACDSLCTRIRAGDRRGGELQLALDAVEARGE